MLERTRARAPLELEKHARLMAHNLRGVGGQLGQRAVHVVVFAHAQLDVVLRLRDRGAQQCARRRIEVHRAGEVLRLGQQVRPFAREAVRPQLCPQRAHEGAEPLHGDRVLELVSIERQVAIRIRDRLRRNHRLGARFGGAAAHGSTR
jgi:hypothetical protein